MSIGARIHMCRKAKQYTLEELANKIGTSRQTLSKYETGKIDGIPSEKIELLAKALDTSPAYLMGWEEKNPADKSGAKSGLQKEAINLVMKLDEKQLKQFIRMIQAGFDL